MMRWIAALMASSALVVCGLVHGFWTDRWMPPVETAQAAQRLDTIPLEIGEWDGEVIDVKPGEAGAGVAGCIKRRYVHRKSGQAVSLFIVCGRPGPVSIHTPEVCYGASGFTVSSKEHVQTESGNVFWRTEALRTNATEETRLRLYWAWNGGKDWTAPEEARVEFVNSPVLHKLYVVRELSNASEAGQREPCEEFLAVLLPTLRRTLSLSPSENH